MSFASPDFFIYFPVVTAIYFLLPQRCHVGWLLIASMLFYIDYIPAYLFVILGLVLVDYVNALLMERYPSRRKFFLIVSIIAMLGVLFFFKYFNFVNSNLAGLAAFLDWQYPIGILAIALPLGISFHTFQSLSYVIEVYRGKQKAERNIFVYALYVFFYPQLVAGPIERPQQLLNQLHQPHHFDENRVRAGLMRMAWGFFKKMVVADHLGLMVSGVFAHPQQFDNLSLLIASIFFTLEIYLDFSGYTDIALGTGKVLGFTLMENFNRPFASKTMAEWWRRWHISLSSWFRDYFYYPITLSQKHLTKKKIYAATILTFLVTGFWHGANWTFGVFGLLNGWYIAFGAATQHIRARIRTMIGLEKFPRFHRVLIAIVVFSLEMLSLVFFRSQSVQEGWYILLRLVPPPSGLLPSNIEHSVLAVATSITGLLATVTLAGIVLFIEQWLVTDMPAAEWIIRRPVLIRWPAYWALALAWLMFSVPNGVPFIYFQF